VTPGDLQGQPLSTVAAADFAACERVVADCEQRYRQARREPAFWALVDLRSSARFRGLAGDERAYVRMEVFVNAFRRRFAHYDEVEVLKELGDALLVRSRSLRPLIEVACLHHLVANLWATGRGAAQDISLAARTAVTFGVAEAVDRDGVVDYLGKPLDRLARLSSAPQDEDYLVAVIEDEARAQDRDLFAEYPFLSTDGPHVLAAALLKPGEAPVHYWRVRAAPAALRDFRDYFSRLR
jgi:hypothetical protein